MTSSCGAQSMSGLDQATRDRVARLGCSYLAEVHRMDPPYEGDELVKLWGGRTGKSLRRDAVSAGLPSLGAFHHFLVEHIR